LVLSDLCGPYKEKSFPKKETSAPSEVIVEDTARASLISQVKDFFPDLGEGFIDACLDHFKNNAERVIDSILGDLPSELAKLDRKMSKKKATAVVVEEDYVMSTRKNIYDNDDFDILANEKLDTSKIKWKKVPENFEEDVSKILNDRSDVQQMKGRYLDYQYEDEPDDSYEEFAGNFALSTETTKDELVSSQEDQGEEYSDEEKEGDEEGEDFPSGTQPPGTNSANQKEIIPGFGRGFNRGGQQQQRGGPPSIGSRGKAYKTKSHNQKSRALKKRSLV